MQLLRYLVFGTDTSWVLLVGYMGKGGKGEVSLDSAHRWVWMVRYGGINRRGLIF